MIKKLYKQLNKKMIVFLLGLLISGIITGSILFIFLSKNDLSIVKDYILDYFNHLNTINLNDYIFSSLISNVILVFSIWILGISMIGLPVILFIYFLKSFILGFTVATFISVFSFKGILISLIFIIFQIVLFSILIYLTSFAVNFSLKLFKTVIRRENFDFKSAINFYFKVLLLSLIVIIIYSLLDNYLLPVILKIMI